jgi:hypothetical protein
VDSSSSRVTPPTDHAINGSASPKPQTGRNRRPMKMRESGLINKTAPAAVAADVGNWNSAFLRDRQLQDADIRPALQWLESDSGRPSWDSVKSGSPFLRSLWQQHESLVLCQGVLYRIFHDVNGLEQYCQYVLPSDLKVPFWSSYIRMQQDT